MQPFQPQYLLFHDYGDSPSNEPGVFNPYHVLVFPDGSKLYRDPNNPYGAPAPHAFRLNRQSLGMSYAGPVGSTPTPEAMAVLRAEYDKIRAQYPDIKPMTHGDAYAATKGTAQQASRDGRGPEEAAWARPWFGGSDTPQVAAASVPVSRRSLTAYAGLPSPATVATPVASDTPPPVSRTMVSDTPRMAVGAQSRASAPTATPSAPAFDAAAFFADRDRWGYRDGGKVEAALRVAARQTDTNPTEAQKQAGNYAKGKVRIHGMEIAIENPKGSSRSGVDKGGQRWTCQLPAHYGYVLGTVGADGDHVDVYIGPDHASQKVFVVDQVDSKTRKFDEHKALLGYDTKDAAVADYKKAFSDGKGADRIGAVTEMSVDKFKTWVSSAASKKPLRQRYADGGAVTMDINELLARAYGGNGYADGGETETPREITSEMTRPDLSGVGFFGRHSPMDALRDIWRGIRGQKDTAFEPGLSEFTGVPSVLRGGARMTEEGVGNKLAGAGEAASGLLPFAAGTRLAAPLFGSMPRALTTLEAPQLMQDAGSFITPAHAADNPVNDLRTSLKNLQTQQTQQQSALEEAKQRLDANRPTNRKPDEKRDPKFFQAQKDYEAAKQELGTLNTRIENTQTRIENASKSQEKAAGGERLKEVQDNKSMLETILKGSLPYAAPVIGMGMGYAGGKGVGKLTDWLDQRRTQAADQFLAGNLSKKPLNDRIGNLNRFWSEGSKAGGEFGTPPFSQTNAAPYWKANRKDVAPSHELYPPRSRTGDYIANGALTGVYGGEAGLGFVWGQQAHEDMREASAAVSADPSEANIQRFEKAKQDALIADTMLRMGIGAGLGQAVKGSMAVYSAPGARPNIGKADSERANIIEQLSTKKAKVKADKAKAEKSAERRSSKKQSQSGRTPNGAASLLPLAVPAATSGLPSQPGLPGTELDYGAYPTSEGDNEDFHAKGGQVKDHHSSYQPRDKVGRWNGGPVIKASLKSLPGRKYGGASPAVMAMAHRYATGGAVHVGPVNGDTGGRSDELPISVPSGSFVIPADIVSALGEGNSNAGMGKLSKMFGSAGPSRIAAGGAPAVPIQISDGEFVVAPEAVAKLGRGNPEQGHKTLERFVKMVRAEHIKTLKSLPGPERD